MNRANNFDLLRLCYASMVVLSHSYALSQVNSLIWLSHVNPRIAVEGFFTISGFLILGSYERSSSFKSYLDKRARRILPAYWASLLFCLLLGATLSTLSLRQFISSAETWRFIAANLCFVNFLHPSLPGLFVSNPLEPAVNGALWTIKIEIMFYLFVPVLVWLCRRYHPWQPLSAIFLLSLFFRVVCEHLHHANLAKQLPGQLFFFASGSLIYYYQTAFLRYRGLMWVTAIGAALAYFWIGSLPIEAVSVSLMSFCFAMLLPHIYSPAHYGDFSYGIYIFHYPIIQGLIALGIFTMHPLLALSAVIIFATLFAIASWYWIESPSLRQRRIRSVELVSAKVEV